MPLLDLTKPEIIKFFNESIEKTASLRMRWNVLHKDKLEKAATFTGEEKGYTVEDVSRSVLEASMPATTQDNINAGKTRRKLPVTKILSIKDLRKEHTIESLGLGDPKEDPRLARPDDDLSFDPIMRPVPPEQKNILYNEGRNAYLKVRQCIKPEDKYYFQESGWIGWRFKDSYFGSNVPLYARQASLKESLISRTGPKPDPSHYAPSKAIQEHYICKH